MSTRPTGKCCRFATAFRAYDAGERSRSIGARGGPYRPLNENRIDSASARARARLFVIEVLKINRRKLPKLKCAMCIRQHLTDAQDISRCKACSAEVNKPIAQPLS